MIFMKKSVNPVVVIVVLVLTVLVVVSVWFYQPFAPKVYGLEPPTPEQRKLTTQQMNNDMREAAMNRPNLRSQR